MGLRWQGKLVYGAILVAWNIFYTLVLVEKFPDASLLGKIGLSIGVIVQIAGTYFLAVIIYADIRTPR